MIVDKFSPSELPQNISFYLMAGIRAKNGINLQNSKLKHLDLSSWQMAPEKIKTKAFIWFI